MFVQRGECVTNTSITQRGIHVSASSNTTSSRSATSLPWSSSAYLSIKWNASTRSASSTIASSTTLSATLPAWAMLLSKFIKCVGSGNLLPVILLYQRLYGEGKSPVRASSTSWCNALSMIFER